MIDDLLMLQKFKLRTACRAMSLSSLPVVSTVSICGTCAHAEVLKRIVTAERCAGALLDDQGSPCPEGLQVFVKVFESAICAALMESFLAREYANDLSK